MADLNKELLALLAANPQLLQQSASQYNSGGWNFSDVMMQRPGSVMSESEAGPQLANAYAFTDRPEMMRQAGASIDPQTGMVSIGGQTMSADDFAKRYKVAMKELSGETGSGATDWQQRLVDSQTGTVAGGDGWTTPGFDLMKDVILPGAAVWGGGYLLGSALGGAGLGGLGGAAGGGDIAGLAANQVGALGGAGGGLGGVGGASGVAAMEALPALTTIGASSIPEIATLASTLGPDFGIAALMESAGLSTLGASMVPTSVESMGALESLAPVGQSTVQSIAPLTNTLGADYGLAELSKLAGSALTPASGSAVKNAMYGDAGYGPGMTGAQTSAYDSVLGATGSKTLADLAANSTIGSSLINGASGISNLVGGGGNLASLVGAVAGASEGGKPNVQTNESKIDPRMQQYLYGTGYGDANSLLGAAQKLYQQNPTGINPTMQQGMDMQKAALTDPAYAQSFQAMRNAGTGLLSQGVAANPFASGNAGGLLNMGQPNAQAGGAGGLMNIDPNAANRLIQMGRGLLPGSI